MAQLDFTPEQIAQAQAALSETGAVWTEDQVTEALAVIRDIALGDPLGTIRVYPGPTPGVGNPSAGIALRYEDEYGRRRWKRISGDPSLQVEDLDDGITIPGDTEWPKVYTPESGD